MRFIAMTALLLGSLTAQAADIKIAVVDMQRALQSVDAGKKAKSSLESEFNAKKKALLDEEEKIKKMGEDFKKQSLVLNDDAKAKKQNEIQERLLKYRETFSKAQMDIQNKERQLTEPIINNIRKIVEDLGNSKGYTIILEKNENSVLFSQQKDDLTEEVVKLFNKKNG